MQGATPATWPSDKMPFPLGWRLQREVLKFHPLLSCLPVSPATGGKLLKPLLRCGKLPRWKSTSRKQIRPDESGHYKRVGRSFTGAGGRGNAMNPPHRYLVPFGPKQTPHFFTDI